MAGTMHSSCISTVVVTTAWMQVLAVDMCAVQVNDAMYKDTDLITIMAATAAMPGPLEDKC